MRDMKRIAFISHVFPPSNRANAKRPFLLAKAFAAVGWNVDIYASEEGITQAYEEVALEEYKCSIFRISDPISRLQQCLENRVGRLWKVLDYVLKATTWPDLPVWWCCKVARLFRSGKYDAVVICVHPKSALLIPLLCAKGNAVWIIDYQESVSPQFKRHPRKSPVHRLLGPMLLKLEKKALSRTDLSVFTSASNLKAYVADGLTPDSKTSHISHFFDEELYDRSLRWDGHNLNIVYAGYFDRIGRRSPELFLRALNGFFEKYPEALGKIWVDFYGRWWPEHDQFVEDLGLKNSVLLHPAVSYEAYLELLQTSAVLLLVTAPEHNLFIPGKLIDYLGACRPILAFTPSDSETVGVLSSAEVDNYICSDSDVSGGVREIEMIWIDYCEKNLSCSSPTGISKWSSVVLAAEFIEIVDASKFGNRGMSDK